MKTLKKRHIAITLLLFGIFSLTYCTKDDQVLDLPGEEPPPPINNTTDLLAVKVTTAPTIDGTIDASWENSPALAFSTAVPEVTGDVFRGFTGNIIPSVTLRAAYDNTNIYFLAEWDDPTQSLARQPWYFDPATNRWAQEAAGPTFSSSGSISRPAFYEDKVALLWNVNNTVSGWNSATCYKSCHTGLPATDGSSRHFTNFISEKIDMWHWKSVRGGVNSYQFDDQYQDNTYPNGRKSDAGAGAYTDNKQTLTITGTTTSVSVPKYMVPGKTNYYWIMGEEITNGTALTVTAVSETGVLTISDGSTVDPNIGTDYQRVGSGLGPKAIPGITVTAYTESRGDIYCKSTYTGTGWILEFQRALKTGDTENHDIDFTSLADAYFGFAIFENAQIAHSIKPNLILKFEK